MKKIIYLMLVMVSALAFVGCGQKDPDTDSTKSIAEDGYTVETIANLNAQAEDSVVVKFRIPFGTTIQSAIREFADEFELLYPSVKIEIDVVSGYTDMKKATIEDIQGGEAPTMTVGYPDHFAEYLITNSIISLDKFIESEEVGYTDEELDDFLPGYISENRQFDKKGTYVGLPFNKSTEALYYNKDFFKEFNLKVPTTWAEFEEVSAEIFTIVNKIVEEQEKETDPEKKKTYSWLGDIKANLNNGEFIPCFYDSGGNMFTTIIHQFGGEYTEAVYKSNGIVDVQRGLLKFDTSSKSIEGLSYLQNLANKNYINLPDAWELTYGSSALCAGKAIMNIGSTGGSSYYSDAICNIDVAPIPYKDEDHKYVIQQGTNVCIMSQASDLEKLAAWLFIKYMLTPENTATFAVATGYMPVRASAYEEQDYLDFLDSPAIAAKVHKATSQYSQNGWNYFVDAAWAGSADVRTECETAVAQILVDKTDISKALADAKGRIGQ